MLIQMDQSYAVSPSDQKSSKVLRAENQDGGGMTRPKDLMRDTVFPR